MLVDAVRRALRSHAPLAPADLPQRVGIAGVAVNSHGTVHIVLDTAEWVEVGEDWEYRSNGLLYATGGGGGVQQLLPAESAGFLDSLAITTDQTGRVHVLFKLDETDSEGLWYAAGPSR